MATSKNVGQGGDLSEDSKLMVSIPDTEVDRVTKRDQGSKEGKEGICHQQGRAKGDIRPRNSHAFPWHEYYRHLAQHGWAFACGVTASHLIYVVLRLRKDIEADYRTTGYISIHEK